MRVWGIAASAGMAAQVKALAESLGAALEMKHLPIHPLVGWLPNACFAAGLSNITIPHLLASGSDTISPPWPDLIISCGRRPAIAALGLRHLIKPPTRFIHIQDPHINPSHFDLVIAMEHDAITGPNVLITRFALHNITPTSLATTTRFTQQFSAYPKPHIAVLLGGSTNKYTLTPQATQKIIATLQTTLANTTGSLLITPSRRTGFPNIAQFKTAFAGNPRVYIYDTISENPYMAMLSLADHLIVTDDSVNMMSEAAATGKPLHILPLPGHQNTKPTRFAQALIADGIARPLAPALESWNYPITNEMPALAAEIPKRLPLP